MLDIVEQDLLRRHLPSVTYLRLDGSVPASQRQDIVNNFNSDPSIDVLLLTTMVSIKWAFMFYDPTSIVNQFLGWRPGSKSNGRRYGHLCRARLESNEGSAGYGPRPPNRPKESSKCLPADHTQLAGGKDHGAAKFKILTANTVVSAENASLQTMGTSQIFDLFNGGKDKGAESGSSAVQGTASGGMSMNTIIENLPELWSEHQYEEEYDLGNFVQALKK